MRGLAIATAVALVALGAPARGAPTLMSSDSPHPGIVHEVWTDTMPARVHVVTIDLTSAEIAVFATQEADRGITTRELASRLAAQVAINGDAFAVAGFRPRGLAIGDRMAWSNTADDATSAVFHLRRTADGTGERTVAGIIPPEEVTQLADLPADTEGVVSGRPLLIRAGSPAASFDCDDPVAIACQRAPRTALALSEDGNTLYLVVVDGWQDGSIGMTAAELAAFLRTTHAPFHAVALDGGSSSTLVLDGALANQPSDGVERAVANHLAVKFGELPHGQLTGLICKDDVIACRDDASLRLPGAEVTLDDGRVQVVGGDALYDFTNITPRLACVTVRLDGFKTKTACDFVPSGGIGFESVALEEGEDPPDAGPRDAGPAVDAAIGLDAGPRPDAGVNPELGDGGGCGCETGRAAPTHALVALLVGFMLLRRRGTTAPR